MAAKIPTVEPQSLRLGDTASWSRSLADYPASAGWSLSYALVKTGTRITFTATASGDDHLVSVPAATTTGWTAGTYQWQARVSKAGEVYTIGTGSIELLVDFATQATGYDARSHARKTLEALEAWIEGRDVAVAEYEIAGRSLKTIPVPDLLKLRDRYRREVRSEQVASDLAAGLPNRNKIVVRI
jgi:hypothetical protein